MVPLVLRLRKEGHNVIIGGGNELLSFFSNEIPGIDTIAFPGFKPSYSKYLPQYAVMLFKIPVLIFHSLSEHYKLKKIIHANNINFVISDNRFGLWNKDIKTVYVTHQLRIPFPRAFRFLEFIGIKIHRAVASRYDHCFIPDLPGEVNLSGRLSHGLKLPANAVYVGILSRFSEPDDDQGSPAPGEMYNCVILSGPEPQRTMLEKKLSNIFRFQDKKTLFLRGKPEENALSEKSGKMIYASHLTAREMIKAVKHSDVIVSRSGYTTLMELVSMKRTALLIPTPGQTEQEYLSSYLHNKGWFTGIPQKYLKETIPGLKTSSVPYDEMISESRILFDSALRIFSEDNQQG